MPNAITDQVPAGMRFQIKPKQASDGSAYVMWALMGKGDKSPFLVVASENETIAGEEFSTWRKAYEASNQDHRAAVDALWSQKFGGLAA